MCKQNDETISVPGNSNLTLKLHKTHRHLVAVTGWSDLGFSVVGGQGGRGAKMWEAETVHTRHSSSMGKRKLQLMQSRAYREKTTLGLREMSREGRRVKKPQFAVNARGAEWSTGAGRAHAHQKTLPGSPCPE